MRDTKQGDLQLECLVDTPKLPTTEQQWMQNGKVNWNLSSNTSKSVSELTSSGVPARYAGSGVGMPGG